MGVVPAFWRKRLERIGKVAPHIRVGILLNRERGGGVPHEHGEEPVACGDIVEPASERARDLDEALALGRNAETVVRLDHPVHGQVAPPAACRAAIVAARAGPDKT